jgi:hypothetical protein
MHDQSPVMMSRRGFLKASGMLAAAGYSALGDNRIEGFSVEIDDRRAAS